MKKLLIACLTLLLLCSAVNAYALSAAVQAVVGSTTAAGATCQASPFLDTFNSDTSKINGTADTTTHYGGVAGYQPAANKTVCKAEFKLDCKYAACSTTTYYAAIYTKSGKSLDAVVGEISNGVTGNNSWSATTVTFTFPGSTYPQVTTSGTYAIVYYSDPVGSGGTSMTMFYTTDAAANGGYAQWATDKSMTDYGSNGVQVRLYAYE